MRETDILVIGAGRTGLAAAKGAAENGARVLLIEKNPEWEGGDPPVPLQVGWMALDLIPSDDGKRIAGALIVTDEGTTEVVKAAAVILATGGVQGLFPVGAKPWNTGDALAMALRIQVALPPQKADLADGKLHWYGGVPTDGAGRTLLQGLYAVGSCATGREEGKPVGALASHDLANPPPKLGDYRVLPDIDSPIAPGFAEHKMTRLRDLLQRALAPGEKHMPARDARVLLHRLKGEADDFARARLDWRLKSFQNACEVGLMVLPTQ